MLEERAGPRYVAEGRSSVELEPADRDVEAVNTAREASEPHGVTGSSGAGSSAGAGGLMAAS